MNKRHIALLNSEIDSEKKVKHLIGMPPTDDGMADSRRQMADPVFLIIEDRGDCAFLYRYSKDGECVGDTWHMNFEDSIEQADYEYKPRLGEWSLIPENVEDAILFGIKKFESEDRN